MKQPLAIYLSELSRAFVISAREATKEAVRLAKNSDALAVDVNIGGVPLKVEGAANLPRSILMLRSTKLNTEAFIDLDYAGHPHVTLKRGLFTNASRIKVEMTFERSQPLESMEVVRDRAVEVLKSGVDQHRIEVAVENSGLTIQALESALARLKEQDLKNESTDSNSDSPSPEDIIEQSTNLDNPETPDGPTDKHTTP